MAAAVPAEPPSGRELEKYDRKFLPKPAGAPQKQRQMLLGLSQLFHVRDETICFDRKPEARRCLRMPVLEDALSGRR